MKVCDFKIKRWGKKRTGWEVGKDISFSGWLAEKRAGIAEKKGLQKKFGLEKAKENKKEEKILKIVDKIKSMKKTLSYCAVGKKGKRWIEKS